MVRRSCTLKGFPAFSPSSPLTHAFEEHWGISSLSLGFRWPRRLFGWTSSAIHPKTQWSIHQRSQKSAMVATESQRLSASLPSVGTLAESGTMIWVDAEQPIAITRKWDHGDRSRLFAKPTAAALGSRHASPELNKKHQIHVLERYAVE